MSWAAIAIGVGTAAYGVISGASKKRKARKLAEANPRPTYEIPQSVIDNQELAESRAGMGLNATTQQMYEEGAERGLTSSIDAILKTGGGNNNIAELYGTYQNGLSRIAMLNAEANERNLARYYAANESMANRNDTQFQVNQYGPYADAQQAAALLSGQGQQDINQGVNSLAGVAGAYAGYANNQNLMKNVTAPQVNNSQPNNSNIIVIGGVPYDKNTMLPIV